jgi:hypothetical protein
LRAESDHGVSPAGFLSVAEKGAEQKGMSGLIGRIQKDQLPAVLVEIDQFEGRQQPLVILLQAAVTHLVCFVQKRNGELRFGGEAVPT